MHRPNPSRGICFSLFVNKQANALSPLQLLKLSDSTFNDLAKRFYFLRRITRCAKGVANLLRGKLSQQISNPPRVSPRNVLADRPQFKPSDELRRVNQVYERRPAGHVEIYELGRNLADEFRIRIRMQIPF
jgi:hypothetical protein